ncbi:MAG: beta-ketoacyl-ACP synthase II [Bacteroidia bacterium]|nr:beta-ketoacyl-ACP synthase II [Bacteroidia bacterium]MDW8159183.1 beta-ketoacyl-ACP synthase II [Bacteroidia bacterium]
MNNRRVVVSGLGVLTPIGNNVSEFWKNLVNGKSGAGPITKFDASRFRTKFACELKNFDLYQHIPPKEARKMDPFSHYAIIAADEAIADAKLDFSKLDTTRIGVIVGSGIGGIQTFTEELRSYLSAGNPPRFSPFFIPRMIVDIASGWISIKYGLRGPNYSCVSACATSAHCIIDSYMLIKMGLADVMLSGGAEAAITEAGIGGFNAMKALSERNDDYLTASRPFDAERDGFVLGEGGGILVLEELSHAQKRNARIYAEIAGLGLSADACHITAPEPEGAGAAQVMYSAIQTAGIKPEEVDYINVHGTSTPLGDVAEIKAIKAVFKEHAYRLHISSNKSMIGHLLGAAGAVEAIATVLTVYHDIIPPTINHFTPDPECDLNGTFNHAVRKTVNVAISNNFGFGGHNASILIKKYQS